MTDDDDPPADRRAHFALRDIFRELAQKRIAAQESERRALETARRAVETSRRVRRRRALMRAVPASVAAVLLTGGIAVAINALTGDNDGPIAGDPRPPGHLAPLPPGERLPAHATTTDPRGGPRWGLSTYTSEKGKQCIIAARVLKGQMGVISNGTFRPLRKGVTGFCDRLSLNHLIFTVRRYSRANGDRTLLFGQVDREVQRLVLQPSREQHRDLHLFSDGTFLVVRPGENALHGSRLAVTIHDKQRIYQLG